LESLDVVFWGKHGEKSVGAGIVRRVILWLQGNCEKNLMTGRASLCHSLLEAAPIGAEGDTHGRWQSFDDVTIRSAWHSEAVEKYRDARWPPLNRCIVGGSRINVRGATAVGRDLRKGPVGRVLDDGRQWCLWQRVLSRPVNPGYKARHLDIATLPRCRRNVLIGVLNRAALSGNA
jgi:hypothetical protein